MDLVGVGVGGATFCTGKPRKTEYKTHKLKERKENAHVIIINTSRSWVRAS
jgi:hypothetical protein